MCLHKDKHNLMSNQTRRLEKKRKEKVNGVKWRK